MFTGLIQSLGILQSNTHRQGARRMRFQVQGLAHPSLIASHLGDSVAVNGVCLTVVALPQSSAWCFEADLMPETLSLSTLGHLLPGAKVNLESALRLGDSLGGHLVSGDVDGTGKIRDLEVRGNALVVRIEPEDAELLRWVVLRGRIAIDGASLTVMELSNRHLAVSLIPHSREHIILGQARVGERCNLETDLLARHFAKAAGLELARAGGPRS